MIVCPSCYHKEIVGTLFCSECGARLLEQEETPEKTAVYTKENQKQETPDPTPPNQPVQSGDAWLSIKIVDTGQILPLSGGDEYTLGRVSGNQPILPDVDLTPYQAYEGGVSRLHATIKIKDEFVSVMDLGSVNGTRVNGKKIPAHDPRPLAHGDTLTLGKFKIQVLFRDRQ